MNQEVEFVIVDVEYRENAEYFKEIFPDRVGSVVKIPRAPAVGHSTSFDYIRDKKGTPKSGYISTGIVLCCHEYKDQLVISAIEGDYVLKRLQPSD